MTFSESFRTCLGKVFLPLAGRASRSEFWWFQLFAFAVMFAFAAVILAIVAALGLSIDPNNPNFGAAGTAAGVVGIVLFFIFYIIAICFFMLVGLAQIAVIVRRFHDRNMSGWWYVGFIFLSLIPIVNFAVMIAIIVICCLKGTDGANKYGPDPLGATGADVFQ